MLISRKYRKGERGQVLSSVLSASSFCCYLSGSLSISVWPM